MLEHLRFAVLLGLVALALVSFGRATWMLLKLRPARAQLVFNAYRAETRMRRGAFFKDERPGMPLRVTDRVEFEDAAGQQVRTDLTRFASRNDRLLTWHHPRDPLRVTATGPLSWLGLTAVCLSLVAHLTWQT